MSEKKQEVTVTPKTIIDDVLVKIEQFRETGELVLPVDYSPENALKSAYLILNETVDKNKVPVLKSCTPISIANCLLDMVVQGLSPMKNQCYFIAYGSKLQLSRSYMGSIAVAKRCGMESVVSNVVFQDDEFAYEIVPETGLTKIIAHKQSMDNIDITKIRGAYAITKMQDGTSNVTIMTLPQIRLAWLQGAAKGNSGAHTNFTDEMCKKTVLNRACKLIINGSTDVMLNTASKNVNTYLDEEETPVPSGEANIREIEVEVEVEEKATVVEKPNKVEKEPTKAKF